MNNLFRESDDHEIGAYRYNDPDTSVEAAVSVDATRLEAIVLEAIRSCREKGATSSELVALTHMDWPTVTPRCRPLVRKGLIYDSGERRKGLWSNRNQIVWKAVHLPPLKSQSIPSPQPGEKAEPTLRWGNVRR